MREWFKTWIPACAGMTIILIGCGGPTYVRIPYLLTNDPAQIERSIATRNIYLLIHPPSRLTSSLTVGKSTVTAEIPYLHPPRLASTLNKKLTPLLGHVMAYRVSADTPENDPFIKEMGPSGVLEISLGVPTVFTTVETKQVTRTVGKTTTTTTEPYKWNHQGRVAVRYKFSANGDNHVWAEGNFNAECNQSHYAEPNPADTSNLVLCLSENVGTWMAPQLPPQPTVRQRTVWSDDKDDISKKAARYASSGLWKQAEDIWTVRVSSTPTSWHDWMNLGISAEANRNIPLAAQHYKRAQQEGAVDPESQKINWTEIFSDLQAWSALNKPTAVPPDSRWFSKKVVVLPFTDNSVSIDGPESIRLLIAALLKDGGYQVTPIKDSDEKLKDHGISDGAHLQTVKTKDVAQWVDADWLIFGDIDEFNEVNVGVYVKRSVHGTLSFWNRRTENTFYSSAIPVENQGFPSSTKMIVANFLSNLGKTWLEHASKKPLQAEVSAFVEVNIEGIPRKPN